MARARTLVLNTKVNVTGADKLKGLGKTFENALNPKNIAGGLIAGFASSQVISFITDATAAAAEFQDSVAASGVIFGEQLIPQMEEWGDKAAQNFGASKQEALEAANVIATLGKSAGLAGQDLVNFSQEMVELGGDLASMFGGTTQDAITAVGAALRGESEPIRRYGVLLDDATLRAKAFELGIISSTRNALTPQQKVLAAQASILEQTSDAQGDFLRTSDGMANTQRELAAEMANLNIEIGEKMLPIMLQLATIVKDDVLPVLRDFLGFADEAGFVIGAIFDQLIPGGWARDWAQEIKDDIETELSRGSTPIGQFVAQNLGGTLRSGAGEFDSAARDLVNGLPAAMQGAQDDAAKVAAQTPGALGNSLRENLDDYQDDLDALVDMAVHSVSDLRERQEIEGVLASEGLTDALNSDSTRTRLQAIELVEDLVADYELLAPGALGAGELVNPELARGMQSNLNLTTAAANAIVDAAGNPLVAMNSYPWGYQIGSELARGMWDSMNLISNAAYAMANTVARQVRIESEPPDPTSPLHGITKWGQNFVKTYAGGIAGSLGIAASSARALGSALVPSVGMTPAVSSAGGGGGITINLTVEGDLTSDRERGVTDLIGRSLGVIGYSDRGWAR